MGRWVPPVLLLSSRAGAPGFPGPLLTQHALTGSRAHLCLAAAPEKGKRVFLPWNAPSPILSGTCKQRPPSCPIRHFKSGFVFLLVEGKQSFYLFFVYSISDLGEE